MSEVLYSVSTPFPDSIVVKRDNVLSLGIARDGVNVAPEDEGTFTLIADTGSSVFSVAATAGPNNTIEAVIPSATLADIATGELYQGRWTPIMPGETDAREFRREAVVTLFKLVPPVSEQDLVDGNYPDLRDQLGPFGTNLQPFLDQAWGWFLRKTFKFGRWPDLLISTHDAFEPVRERAWFLIFRFLFRRTRGTDNRFEILWRAHGKSARDEFRSMSARWDEDHDGVADSLNREAAVGAVHRNSAPRRRLRRDRRWG